MKIDYDRIMQEVKDNHKKLDNCKSPHDFIKKTEELFPKYVCKKCGGEIEHGEYYWYKLGLKHGGDPV